jgi:hypothetical protein
MIKVSVEEVRELLNRIMSINALELEEIVWTERGIELNISQRALENFEFTGLNNIDFIMTGMYKKYKGEQRV